MRLSSWQLCAPAAPTSLAPSVGSSGLGVSVSGHLGREGDNYRYRRAVSLHTHLVLGA